MKFNRKLSKWIISIQNSVAKFELVAIINFSLIYNYPAYFIIFSVYLGLLSVPGVVELMSTTCILAAVIAIQITFLLVAKFYIYKVSNTNV